MSNLKQFASEASATSAFTTDVIELFQRPYQPLFVYNLAKKDFSDHCMIEKDILRYCGDAFTVAGDFVMYTKKLGKYSWPIAVNKDEMGDEPELFDGEAGKIKGELYLVRTESLIVLDEEYMNGLHCDRINVPVVVPYRIVGGGDHTMKENIVHAYTYVGCPDYFGEQIKTQTYEASAFYISKNTEGLKYYNFTKKELSE